MRSSSGFLTLIERVFDLRADVRRRRVRPVTVCRGHARAAHVAEPSDGSKCVSKSWMSSRATSGCAASVCWINCSLSVHADLADVLAVRAQHDHFVPLQLRAEDEAIEAVVLRLAVPDADERFLKLLLDRREVVLHPLARRG